MPSVGKVKSGAFSPSSTLMMRLLLVVRPPRARRACRRLDQALVPFTDARGGGSDICVEAGEVNRADAAHEGGGVGLGKSPLLRRILAEQGQQCLHLAQQSQRIAQFMLGLRREDPGLAQRLQRLGGGAMQDLRRRSGLAQHQVLHDEFEVDQPAGAVFEIPRRGSRVLGGDAPPHLGDVDQQATWVTR